MNNLSRFGFFVLLIAATLFYNNDIKAQNSCDLSSFTTYTQGGWGSPSNSGPGKVRDANFAAVFPKGLTIGSVYTLTLTDANAVMDFLPEGGTPEKLKANYNNPTKTDDIGVLAGQMVALTLNVKFNNAGVLGDNSLKLEDLVIAKGALAGKTVKELMDLANRALGGESVGYLFSDLNDAATSVNENFDNGTVNKGSLTCSLASATLGDKVWFDSNKNGIQDAGEGGIQNITAQLYNSTGDVLLATTTTDANGLYLFNNLSAGSYYVKFAIPDGYKISPITQGTNQAVDSNPDQTGRTGIITLAKGEHNLTIDAGLYTQLKTDLSVVKTVSKNNPQCGEEIVYTIKITNNGPDNATNIQVNDLLPDGLIFSSYQADAGTYNKTSGTWTIDNLENGVSKTLAITVRVDCSVFNNNTMDLGPAKGYNLFVLGDITQPSSDTEGKVAVGGNASFANYSIGDKLPLNSGDVLIVDGTLTFTSGRVYNGNVAYGTSTNLPISTVSIDGGELRQAHPIDFASAKSYFQHMSSTLANYNANGSTDFKWGKLTLNGIDPYLNVFKVSGTDLSNANNFEINAPNGSVVVVNIDGANDKWSGGVVINGTSNTLTLFNFYEAKNLSIQGIDLRGTLLSPLADLNFPTGLISGQAIVKSMTGSGQFNNVQFIGNVPVSTTITNVANVVSNAADDPDQTNNTSEIKVTAEYLKDNGSGSNEGNNGGNTGSNTGTNNWQSVYSFGAGEIVYTMVYNGNDIYAGTWGGHIYKSTDNGANWAVINSGMNAAYIWSLTFDNGVLFAATEKGIFSYNGKDWTATTLTGKDVHTLICKNGVLYAGTWGYGIFKSSDNGAHWTEINNGLSPYLALQSLTVDNSGNLYAGTASGGIFRSPDSGETWSKVDCAYDYIWALGSSSNAVFAGTYGDGLYKSVNGSAWTKVTSMPSSFIYSITVDGSGKIYASSWTNGVFTSTDNGNTWSTLGLGGLGVSSVAVNPTTMNVFAGTSDGTVYYSIAKTSGVENKTELPKSYNLSQNYPNPFNPSTVIEFSIAKAGNYSIRIYDMLGKEVATIASGNYNPGVYKANFTSNSLSTGVYIYRLSGENINIVKKMMLMK